MGNRYKLEIASEPGAWERRRLAGELLCGDEERADGTPVLPGEELT